MPACAGAYVSGDEGVNECPAGSMRIETEAACRTAAAAAGKTVDSSVFVVKWSPVLRGCHYSIYGSYINYAYLNTHAVGARDPTARLLCAVETTGAPFTHRRARARTGDSRARPVRVLFKWVLKNGRSKGTRKGGTQKGYSQVLQTAEKLLRVRAYSWDIGGQCSAMCVWGTLRVWLVSVDGSIYRVFNGYSQGTRSHGYSRGTRNHGYSQGTNGVLRAALDGGCCATDARTRAATEWCLRGTHKVLTGYRLGQVRMCPVPMGATSALRAPSGS
jgi:hypothetical protein